MLNEVNEYPNQPMSTASAKQPEFPMSVQSVNENLKVLSDQLTRCEGILQRICGTDVPPRMEDTSDYPSGVIGSVRSLDQLTRMSWERLQDINCRLEEVFG